MTEHGLKQVQAIKKLNSHSVQQATTRLSFAANSKYDRPLAISASEAHASLRRAVASGLAVAPARGEWAPVRSNLLEFVLHGVRYVWPATLGPVKRGVPLSPLYRTAPQAALADPGLHCLLACWMLCVRGAHGSAHWPPN